VEGKKVGERKRERERDRDRQRERQRIVNSEELCIFNEFWHKIPHRYKCSSSNGKVSDSNIHAKLDTKVMR